MTMPGKRTGNRRRGRANGEGSIFPYRSGYAAQAWVTTPAGQRKRAWVYGKTREEGHKKWIRLQGTAAKVPVPTTTPTIGEYLASWLTEVIEPNRELATFDQYETMSRLYIVPELGGKRIDRLQVRENLAEQSRDHLPVLRQGKDAARPPEQRRCCATGQCCGNYPGKRTVQAARNTLRTALTQAQIDELVPRNVASLVKIPSPPKRRRKGASWSVEEASLFLKSAQADHDPLYAAYVLILIYPRTAERGSSRPPLASGRPDSGPDRRELATPAHPQDAHPQETHQNRS